MIKIWKEENLPLEKLFSSLFANGRLSHAFCHIPMDRQFISYVAEHFGVDCGQAEFWRNCFKGDSPCFVMFLQRMLCSNLIPSQSWEHSIQRQFNFDASVDEVDKAASSLVSEVCSVSCFLLNSHHGFFFIFFTYYIACLVLQVNSDDQSLFIASHLYYDLSERLFSGGQLFKVLYFYSTIKICIFCSCVSTSVFMNDFYIVALVNK